MRVSVDVIKTITQGAVRVFEKDGYICFRRFSAEQEELYRVNSTDFWKKSFSTAGIRLCFQTNSEHVSLSARALESSTRTYFSVDVFVDENYIGSMDNFTKDDLVGDYTVAKVPVGRYQKEFHLGEGMKTITIYFPWSVDLQVEGLCLDDNAEIIPVKVEKTMLVFGDSITHGYDAVRPMNRYVSMVANALQAEEINKAIGGEGFFPELAKIREEYDPDFIVVAYGTNDWGTQTWDSFVKRCPEFYQTLADLYPSARIFALTPIWRKDYKEVRQCCDFLKIGEYIREVTQSYDNIVVIDCFDFVPKDESYFADFRLHPNDSGFEYYGRNLIDKLKEILPNETCFKYDELG